MTAGTLPEIGAGYPDPWLLRASFLFSFSFGTMWRLQFSCGEDEAMKNEIHVNRFAVLTAVLFTALLSACNLDT